MVIYSYHSDLQSESEVDLVNVCRVALPLSAVEYG